MGRETWGRFERLRSEAKDRQGRRWNRPRVSRLRRKRQGDGSSVSVAKRRTDREDDGTVPMSLL